MGFNWKIMDDLKSNFRKWEMDSDNEKDCTRLASIIARNHNVSYVEAYKHAKHWTGYEEPVDDNEYVLIDWPDSQNFMETNWFVDEAVAHPTISGAYFIPKNRLVGNDLTKIND